MKPSQVKRAKLPEIEPTKDQVMVAEMYALIHSTDQHGAQRAGKSTTFETYKKAYLQAIKDNNGPERGLYAEGYGNGYEDGKRDGLRMANMEPS